MSWITQTLRALIADLQDDVGLVNLEEVESYKWRVEMVYRDLLVQEIHGNLRVQEREALHAVAEAFSIITGAVESMTIDACATIISQADLVHDGSVGRPNFEIPFAQLQYFLDNRFSVPQIANLLNVSVSTIRRRMTLYNLSVRATYSNISDEELDLIVLKKQQEFPNWGNRQMYGYLLSQNLRVQYHRVREAQSRVDPHGSALRRLTCINRRSYSVQGPQHLWHVDGNHKLIR